MRDVLIDSSTRSKAIYIYGEGPRGRMLLDYLESGGIGVEAFVVSDGYKNYDSVSSAMGTKIPVIEFSDLKHRHPDASKISVLKTVFQIGAHTLRDTIDEYLVPAGGEACVDVVDSGRFDLQFDVLRTCLDAHHADLSKEVIDFGDTKIYNPIFVNKKYLAGMFTQTANHVLPMLYGDHSYADQGPYDREEVSCREGDVVLDAGANMGLFSCIAAARGCKVYAVDPSKEAQEILKRQIDLYPNRIILLPIGLSDNDGSMIMYANDDIESGSTSIHRGPTLAEYEVLVSKLDTLVRDGRIERVDFIKADTVGSENAMLIGAAETIKRFHPKMATRTVFHPGDLERQMETISNIEPKYHFEHTSNKLFSWVPSRLADRQ